MTNNTPEQWLERVHVRIIEMKYCFSQCFDKLTLHFLFLWYGNHIKGKWHIISIKSPHYLQNSKTRV